MLFTPHKNQKLFQWSDALVIEKAGSNSGLLYYSLHWFLSLNLPYNAQTHIYLGQSLAVLIHKFLSIKFETIDELRIERLNIFHLLKLTLSLALEPG